MWPPVRHGRRRHRRHHHHPIPRQYSPGTAGIQAPEQRLQGIHCWSGRGSSECYSHSPWVCDRENGATARRPRSGLGEREPCDRALQCLLDLNRVFRSERQTCRSWGVVQDVDRVRGDRSGQSKCSAMGSGLMVNQMSFCGSLSGTKRPLTPVLTRPSIVVSPSISVRGRSAARRRWGPSRG